MSDIRDLLVWLEEAKEVKGSKNIIFDDDEIEPVIFNKPQEGGDDGGGGGGGQPPQYDDDVNGEVWTKPQKGGGSGEQGDSPFEVKEIGEKEPGEEKQSDQEQGKGEKDKKSDKDSESGESDGDGDSESGESDGDGDKKKKGKSDKKGETEEAGKSGEEGETTYEMNGERLGNTTDSHDIFDKIGTGEKTQDRMERTSKNIAKEIQDKANKERKRMKRGQTGAKGPGGGPDSGGNFFEETLDKIFKPKVDWTLLAGALNNHFVSIRPRMSELSKKPAMKNELSKIKKTERSSKIKKPSYAKSLTNPKNQLQRDFTGKGRKVLEPGDQKYLPEMEVNIVVALDTSGSVSQKFIDIAAAELNNISQQLEKNIRGSRGQKLKGKTWLMTWSSSPSDIAIEEFKKGDFEKYAKGQKKIKTAHAGTVPATVFDYIDGHIIKLSDNLGKINLKEKPEQDKIKPDDTYIPMTEGKPSTMPFLLFITDAGFNHKVAPDELGNYANNATTLKAVWYLILDASESDKEMCYPKNIIEYNIVKV